MLEEFLWVEKYRPKTVADTILPEDLKKVFQQFVDQKNIPNLILSGTAGVGKTTVAAQTFFYFKNKVNENHILYISADDIVTAGLTLRDEGSTEVFQITWN